MADPNGVDMDDVANLPPVASSAASSSSSSSAVAAPFNPAFFLFSAAVPATATTAAVPAELAQRVRIPYAIQDRLGMEGLRRLDLGFTEPAMPGDRETLPLSEVENFFELDQVLRHEYTHHPQDLFERVLDRAKLESTVWDRLETIVTIMSNLDGTEYGRTHHLAGSTREQEESEQNAFDRDTQRYTVRLLARLTQPVLRQWVLALLLQSWELHNFGEVEERIARATFRARRIEWLLRTMRELGWGVASLAGLIEVWTEYGQRWHQCMRVGMNHPSNWSYDHRASFSEVLEAACVRAEEEPLGAALIVSWFDDWELRLPVHSDDACRRPIDAFQAIQGFMPWLQNTNVLPEVASVSTCNTLDKVRTLHLCTNQILAPQVRNLHHLVRHLRPLDTHPEERMLMLAMCLDLEASAIDISNMGNWDEVRRSDWLGINPGGRIEQRVYGLFAPANGLGFRPVAYDEIKAFCSLQSTRRWFVALGVWPPTDWPPKLEEGVRLVWTRAYEHAVADAVKQLPLTIDKPQLEFDELRRRGVGLLEGRRGTLPRAWVANVATFVGGGPVQPYLRALQQSADSLSRQKAVWAAAAAAVSDMQSQRSRESVARQARREEEAEIAPERRKARVSASAPPPQAVVAAAAAAPSSDMQLGNRMARSSRV